MTCLCGVDLLIGSLIGRLSFSRFFSIALKIGFEARFRDLFAILLFTSFG